MSEALGNNWIFIVAIRAQITKDGGSPKRAAQFK